MRTDFTNFGEHLVERRYPDREGGARCRGRVESEQLPERAVEIFADAVVQRQVQAAALRRW